MFYGLLLVKGTVHTYRTTLLTTEDVILENALNQTADLALFSPHGGRQSSESLLLCSAETHTGLEQL